MNSSLHINLKYIMNVLVKNSIIFGFLTRKTTFLFSLLYLINTWCVGTTPGIN